MFAIINTGAEMPRSCARPAAPELELAFFVPRRRPHHRPAIAHSTLHTELWSKC